MEVIVWKRAFCFSSSTRVGMNGTSLVPFHVGMNRLTAEVLMPRIGEAPLPLELSMPAKFEGFAR